jgi:hypothetical protein
MAATVYFWHTLQFDVFHVNPPLTRIVSGLPVLLCQPEHNWDYYSSRPQDRTEWAMGTAFLAANTPSKIRWCFAVARWSLIPVLLLGGYFGYRLSQEIFGHTSGIVFLVLWTFSPLLLGWGATICPDAVAAALGIIAVYYFRRWLLEPSWTRAAATGVCLGLLPLTKLTWIVAFILWPVIGCLWVRLSRHARHDNDAPILPPLRQLAVILLVALYTLNLGYMFDGTFRPLGKYEFASEMFTDRETKVESQEPDNPKSNNRFAGTLLGKLPVPLPAEFLQGIDTQRCDFERGMPSYLRGEWSDHGWWYYYLYVSLVKMPLGTWCLLFLAIFVTLFRRDFNATWQDEMLILIPLITLLFLVSSQTGFSLHSRYIIPAIPFLLLWISKVGRAFDARHKLLAKLTAGLLTWMVVSSLWIYPFSMSYFNELVGGPTNGPKHLLGSNVDWGQDLYYLENWCQEHPEASPIHVAYDGMYPLEKTKITSAGAPLAGSEHYASQGEDGVEQVPRPGWYALSVNEIYGKSKQYWNFLQFEPVAMAGYSIYIYHITTPNDADRVRRHATRSFAP